MTTETMSKPGAVRDAIAAEIKAALRRHDSLTSADLVAMCPSASDSTEISRVIYLLRQSGAVVEAGERLNGIKGRGQQRVKAWALRDAPAPQEPKDVTAASERQAEPASDEAATAAEAVLAADNLPCMHGIDETEMALMDIVDQADEAALIFADKALGHSPIWKRLRRLQSEAFDALCDYRREASND